MLDATADSLRTVDGYRIELDGVGGALVFADDDVEVPIAGFFYVNYPDAQTTEQG